jgi:hypothetical protein
MPTGWTKPAQFHLQPNWFPCILNIVQRLRRDSRATRARGAVTNRPMALLLPVFLLAASILFAGCGTTRPPENPYLSSLQALHLPRDKFFPGTILDTNSEELVESADHFITNLNAELQTNLTEVRYRQKIDSNFLKSTLSTALPGTNVQGALTFLLTNSLASEWEPINPCVYQLETTLIRKRLLQLDDESKNDELLVRDLQKSEVGIIDIALQITSNRCTFTLNKGIDADVLAKMRDTLSLTATVQSHGLNQQVNWAASPMFYLYHIYRPREEFFTNFLERCEMSHQIRELENSLHNAEEALKAEQGLQNSGSKEIDQLKEKIDNYKQRLDDLKNGRLVASDDVIASGDPSLTINMPQKSPEELAADLKSKLDSAIASQDSMRHRLAEAPDSIEKANADISVMSAKISDLQRSRDELRNLSP